ncbi:MAG: voltage-gated chloride channel protein [Moraxellaceae bacterium]|nr:MAG: voltage-gated chloride channel protein [Moraxellaceae bacterium]
MKIFPSSEYSQIIRYTLYWLAASLAIGLVSGGASTLVYICFDLATDVRSGHQWFIFLLPLIGLAMGYLFYKLGTPIEKGTHLLIDEIHQPRAFIPKRMSPLVFLSTIVTQLFGGSAGREAPAVQLSGALSDHLAQIFRVHSDNRKIFLIASIGSGFASIFGTPLAGAFFGLEITALGSLRYSAVFPCFLSAIVAAEVPKWVHIVHPHEYYKIAQIPALGVNSVLSVMLAGICFGLAARLFIFSIHAVSAVFKRYIRYMPFRPMLGGLLIMLLTLLVSNTDYNGLGVRTIVSSFYIQQPVYDFLYKTVFTALTLGSGFKGGEITPLFFVGTTLGNALGLILPVSFSLLAGLGLVGIFSGASKAPLTSIVLAIELFGSSIATYAIIACLFAYLFSGNCGLYRIQRPNYYNKDQSGE